MTASQSAQRAKITALEKRGVRYGLASYVEILTCLEMAENARRTPKSRGPGSLLSREGAPRDFRESCPSALGLTRAELVPDSCF